MKQNIVKDKSFAFAIRTVNLYKHLIEKKKEYILSKQMLRSGTAVGASVRESEHAESTADFIHKMSIALKEANETQYWLLLIHQTRYISVKEFKSIDGDVEELIRLLISIIKSMKTKLK